MAETPNSKYDEFSNLNPTYRTNRGNVADTVIVPPKPTIATLPSHARYSTATPAAYTPVPNANTATMQTFDRYIEAGKPASNTLPKESPSFLGGLYDSVTSGTKNLFSSGPGMYAIKDSDGKYVQNADGTYMNNGTDFGSFAKFNNLDTSKLSGEDLLAYKQIHAQEQANSGLLGGLGGAKGVADLGAGLASLYSIYNGYQQNKRADEALDMQKQEYNRGVAKDKAFAANVAKSGLGSYSAGV